MNRTLSSVLSVLLLLVAGALYAADDATDAPPAAPDQVIYDAHTAFAFLKSMVGTWEGSKPEHDHGTATARTVDVKLTAAGSAVMQTLFPGDNYEMVNVYHMDGDTLLFTHYCAAQNAPVMKFEKSDVPGEIKFVFNGGTNFDPNVDIHAHEGSYFVKDKDTVASKFITWAGGKPQPMLEGTMVRKSAG